MAAKRRRTAGDTAATSTRHLQAAEVGTELVAAQSVVEVISTSALPQYAYPYAQPLQTSSQSTAFMVDFGEDLGQVLLCTHHAVQNASCVQVKRRDHDRRYDAQVIVTGFECDLALLKVQAKDFWKSLVPLELDMALPPLLAPVTVLGFAQGGQNLCTTQGVVSRLDVMSYTGCYVKLPVLQIDAAINSGSSGGPALSGGRVLGAAFSALNATQAQNVGYLVPSKVVARFVRDFRARGHYTQFCFPPFTWQSLLTEDARKYYQVQERRCGVRISHIHASAVGKLKPDDVLLSIDGQTVGHDGKVPMDTCHTRVSLWVLFAEKLTSEYCTIRILRQNREQDLKLRLKPYRPIIPEDPYCRGAQDYFIVAGLVFQPVSGMYLRDLINIGEEASMRSMCERMNSLKDYSWCKEEQADGSNRFIILGDVLQHPVNVGVSYYQILRTFNGQPVRGLQGLAKAVDKCKKAWMRFEFLDDVVCVMSAKQGHAATKEVMKQFGLTTDRRLT